MLRKTYIPLTRSLVRSYRAQYGFSTVASQESNSSDAVPDSVNDLSKPVHVRLPKRSPFMKSMFLGTVDTELLTFPESLNREEQSRLTKHAEQVRESLKPAGADASFNNLDALCLQGPLEYGGKQFIETELAYVSELMSEDRAAALVTLEHNTIVKILAQHGTDVLKEKYLQKMCAGEAVATSALYEVSSSRQTMFSTVANLDFANRKWTLNGSKVLLRNDAAEPNLLLVVASTKNMAQLNKEDGTVAVFLVDVQTKGVNISQTKIGSKGLSRVTVDFNHVELPEANLVGTEHGGAEIMTKFLSAARVQSSVVRVSLLKKILNSLTDFCINTKTSTGEMMDIEIVREQLARMASVIYAAESMIYMTTSLMDDFDSQDVEMEAAITKVFSADNLLKFATLPLQLLGPQALTAGNPFEGLFDDALKLFTGDESLDSVNFFIALTGLQYAGMHSYETIKKDRNPAMYPSHVLLKLFEKTSIEHPKKFANLQQFFHPSLDPAALWIEFSIVRMKLATECVLSRHGIEVIDRHVELGRLANIATQIYAMVATASRASRSYCIGLRHADHEVHLANMLCRETSEKIRLLAIELEKGPYITSDDDYNVVARNLFREKRYFFEHPITKNF
ncbi:complex I assembly factor ACAD9, mitochondrial [Anopheles ziemanni]|uniref:complex I assembly factor ACAD9, mitochondrial n=1 Tax=Anopheles coustani TaxID=139045 RepID=UPI00265A1DBD|nr:complex I assembly factor ACAD9, mitochondrial [Anopheles coustani]XP_058175906.1 complex I assembly factor ACAD9, mitochondrial [Anopheles ziemanni]